jgi:hypothetical protein
MTFQDFLNGTNNTQMFKAALTFSLSVVGIPIVYYGDEQEFSGGTDGSDQREPLWGYMDTESVLY